MQYEFPAVHLPILHIQQREPGDCLVACAYMVLRYLGKSYRYGRIRRLLQVQKGYGTPFPRIRALARLNVDVVYQQGTLHDLYRYLIQGWPSIVPVKTSDLPHWENIQIDHAVVVVGIDSFSVNINDPAFDRAPIRVPIGDFDLAWLERNEM
ncbi:C39 family peptidase [Chloroflexi bacterium TSY]|nr:C39 family peptidase [Chloroflexi bacterium TSY]